MADKSIVATLRKINGFDYLSFKISDAKVIDINLNSDDQSQLKELFFEIINDLFNDNISLSLEYEVGYDQSNIFSDVAKEYLIALNEEIKTVKQTLPNKDD